MQICAGIIHNHSFRFSPQNILSQPLHKAVIIILNFGTFYGDICIFVSLFVLLYLCIFYFYFSFIDMHVIFLSLPHLQIKKKKLKTKTKITF